MAAGLWWGVVDLRSGPCGGCFFRSGPCGGCFFRFKVHGLKAQPLESNSGGGGVVEKVVEWLWSRLWEGCGSDFPTTTPTRGAHQGQQHLPRHRDTRRHKETQGGGTDIQDLWEVPVGQ